MSIELTPSEIIRAAYEMLETARFGLADASSVDPKRRRPGIRNAVVFGRAVTSTLEKLRSRVDNFDDWYKPETTAMGQDPEFRRLYKLRSEILKEGVLVTGTALYIDYLDTDDLADVMKDPPPNAEGFFIGDQLGGSGWSVRMDDGTFEKYYVQLPPEVQVSTKFHLSVDGQDVEVEPMLRRYLDRMQQMVDEARGRFDID